MSGLVSIGHREPRSIDALSNSRPSPRFLRRADESAVHHVGSDDAWSSQVAGQHRGPCRGPHRPAVMTRWTSTRGDPADAQCFSTITRLLSAWLWTAAHRIPGLSPERRCFSTES